MVTDHDDRKHPTGALTRGQTVFMVAALVLSVASFMLNATMLSPAIRDINTHLGPTHSGRYRVISILPAQSAMWY